MPQLSPTALAVADAITRYRELQELTRDELSQVLVDIGHPITVDALTRMENRETAVTVDDLMALAVALNTTPAVMLSHIPLDMPVSEGPLGTGLPSDVEPSELRGWVEGRTSLDPPVRVQWYQDRVNRFRVLSAHHEEQLQAVYAELRDLGEVADQEADTSPVQILQDRVHRGEQELNQSEIALAMAEQHLRSLQKGAH